jgi:hypothetical protein
MQLMPSSTALLNNNQYSKGFTTANDIYVINSNFVEKMTPSYKISYRNRNYGQCRRLHLSAKVLHRYNKKLTTLVSFGQCPLTLAAFHEF